MRVAAQKARPAMPSQMLPVPPAGLHTSWPSSCCFRASWTPLIASLVPTASWMPRTIELGMTLLTTSIRRVAPSSSTVALTNMPAATISGTVSPSVSATLAIVFIGWTPIGMPNIKPDAILYSPVKMSVVPRSRPI